MGTLRIAEMERTGGAVFMKTPVRAGDMTKISYHIFVILKDISMMHNMHQCYLDLLTKCFDLNILQF